ncbi:MAG: hypothetical protein EU532_09415 [Promethearchaeota archaeon]|nr:MAG: hypothetical protein EU532_09415 [Candidatus Lokiarchaeota archaeon]
MSDSDKIDDDGEDIGEILKLLRRKISFGSKFFTKDIEISRKDFLILFLILNSLIFLLIGQIGLDLMIMSTSRFGNDQFAWASIFNGLLIGLIVSVFIVDYIRRPLFFIKYVLIFSFLTTFIQISLILFQLYLILNILFFINVFFITIALMVNGKHFLYKTNILERARIWSYLFMFSFIVIAIVFSILFFNYMIIIPVSFILITIFFLNLKKNKDTIIFHKPKKYDKKHINYDLIKYYLFFSFFGLTAGLATPTEGSLAIFYSTLGGNIALIFVIIIIFAIIASLLIGIIFDYFGRIGALSYAIFAIGLANYIHTYQSETQDLPLAVVFSAYIALIMCVPLLIGDSTTRDRYGKSLSFSYLLIGIGILLGLYLRISIPIIILNVILAENVISGTIFMACMICLVFLLNMRETLPSKEQEWKKFLIHMYIIHDSGILLYEHNFNKEYKEGDSRNVSADLKAGGIIGVKNILKEIIRGEKEIRTIDHGDRILMLKMNNTGKIVFALVVTEKSIVIRKKLELLIEDFDKGYKDFTNELTVGGVDMRIFKPIKLLARKHFGK